MTHRIFVYGTLKRNEPNHDWLADTNNGVAIFVAEAKSKAKYPLVITTKYNIPFLLNHPGKGYNVVGEIYDVDDKMLQKLDCLEDHPVYYQREVDDVVVEKIRTNTVEQIQDKAWVYFLRNFRKDLLMKPFIENYSSKGNHGLEYVKYKSMESDSKATIRDLDEIIEREF